MNKLFSILAMILFVSCSITQEKAEKKLRIFKHGTYYHDVKVTLNENVLNFKGVNKISNDDIYLIFLSSFGSTLISYHYQISSGENELYFDPKQIQVNKKQIHSIIKYILRIYEVDKDICKNDSCYEDYDGMSFSYDLTNKVVTQIKIVKKNMIEINIQITGFKNAKEN